MTEILHSLSQVDTNIFLYFNGMHNHFWDCFMQTYSSRFVWIPFYASFLFVMFKNFPPKATLTCLLFIVGLVLVCDQTTSTLIKPIAQRLRPSNLDNPISDMVHIVKDYRGGKYGFPSSHSANAWSMAIFAIYLTRRKSLGIFLVCWAALMSYTRIYLGLHYPGDLLVGMAIGAIAATAAYYLYRKTCPGQVKLYAPEAGPLRFGYLPITVGTLSIVAMLASYLFM